MHRAITAKPWLPGLRVAVASSDSRERVLENLRLLGFGDKELKEITVISAETERLEPKPNSAVYLAACKSLQMEPKNCVAFEDTQAGIESATSGGLRCVSVRTSDSELQDHSRATLTVTQDEFNATDFPIIIGWATGVFKDLSPLQAVLE